MPSLVDQFKQAQISKESLVNFSSALKKGTINPFDWNTDEINQLIGAYLKIFKLDDLSFIEERIKFNHDFVELMVKACADCADPIRKKLFEHTYSVCNYYIKLMEPKLAQAEKKTNKRPLSNQEVPKPKKRRISPAVQVVNPEEKHLKELGYSPYLIQAILYSDEARKNYDTLIRWHELSACLFNHEQLVIITLAGGEESFTALNNNRLAIIQHQFTAQDIFRLIEKPNASIRLASLFQHIDYLILWGFTHQQLLTIGASDYASQNLHQMNDQLFQFTCEEVTRLLTQCPPEVFLSINQNLDSFTSLSLTAHHLLTLIDKKDFPRIQWLIHHGDILNFFEPDILCHSDLSQLQKDLEKIEQLIAIGYPKELLQGQSFNSLELLIEYTPQLTNFGYYFEDIIKLVGSNDYQGQISKLVACIRNLADLGYSQEHLKQLTFSSWGLPLLAALVQDSPTLLLRGYSTEDIVSLVTDILMSVSEQQASSLKDAVKFTSVLLAHGFQPLDITAFFCKKRNHEAIIVPLLLRLPQLFELGFTTERIIKIASKFDLNTYLEYFNRLKDLNYSSDQILMVEKSQKFMLTVAELTPTLLQQGYSIDNIVNIATKSYPAVLISASEFTPELTQQGYSLTDLMIFFTRQIKHRDVILTLREVTSRLITLGLTATQIIKIASYCKSEGLLLLVEHFQLLYENFKAKEPHKTKEKLLSKLVWRLSDFHALNFIKNLLQAINVPSGKPDRLLPHLLKKTKYYCPHLKSYLFIYQTEAVHLTAYSIHINNLLGSLNFSGRTKALKEHFALLMEEQLWSRLWPDIPPPEETLTPEDLQDKSLNPQNYHRTETQDTAVYIDCHTTASAQLCANHLKYLNQQVQKANEGIEETIPQFQAIAMDKYVFIDNYGAYFDSLSSEYDERYTNFPKNVDDFNVLAADEAQRLGLINQDLGAQENSLDALFETDALDEFFVEGEPQDNSPNSPGSLSAFGFFSTTSIDTEQIDNDVTFQELDHNPFKYPV